jgi:hypothetical protein
MSVIRRFALTQQRDVTPRALDGAMSTADRRLAALATGQLGSFNRRQAHAAGVTDQQLRSRIQSGFLDQIGPNVFRSPYVAEMPLASLVALMLDIGEPCWASGATAAALHGSTVSDSRRHSTSPFSVDVTSTVEQRECTRRRSCP